MMSVHLNAQNKYIFLPKTDPFTTLGSGLVLGSSIYFQQHVKPLSDDDIAVLDKKSINRLDRIACSYWNTDIAHVSDGVAIGSGLMFLYFVARTETRSQTFNIANVAFQSVLLSQALSNASKLSLRNRPYLYNPSVDMKYKRNPDSRMSFFSAHTSTVSSLCFSFAFAHSQYFNEGKPEAKIFIPAAIVPAIQGFLRVRAGKHYPSDVVVGYVIGLGSSFLMHKLHSK